MQQMQRVLVVGAGILGAAIACQLAQRGVRVQVVEQHHGLAAGVSGQSFGWVNLVNGDPLGSPGAHRLRIAAVAEFARVARDFADPPWCRRVGALVWHADPRETQRLIERQQRAGASIRAVQTREIRVLEPALMAPPAEAAYCPEDRAVDVAAMIGALLGAAQARGAVLAPGERVVQVFPHDGQKASVITTTGTHHADVVVLAAALATTALLEPLGVALPLGADPAVLLRLTTARQLARGIIQSPALEVRQDHAGTVLVAEDPEPGGDDRRLAASVVERLRATFGPAPDLRCIAVSRSERPLPRTTAPIAGWVPGLPGIYVLVAHPGVILAPLLARVAADEILGAGRDGLPGDWVAEARASTSTTEN